MSEGMLFELLCVGLETKPVHSLSLEHFRELSQEDWQALRKMSEKQGVSAIVFDGLSELINNFGRDQICPNINPVWWQTYAIKWIGHQQQVEGRNYQQKKVTEEMAKQWADAGCRVMVMKGQACARMYPRPEHRVPGDIDCYLFENYTLSNNIARKAGAKVNERWYMHSQIHYKGEMFENHQFFVHTREGKRSKLLEKELEEALNSKVLKDSTTVKMSEHTELPPVQWNAMFLTYHACSHFISEGMRLKQLLDWAMLLNKHQNDVDWPQFYSFCERHHLRRFAEAATAISVEYLGIKITNPAITTVSPYAEKILNSALYDNDYVFGSGESGWNNRWHLVRNLFHYRWKYEKIYQTSVWKQLWWYVSGYLFKTE